MCNNRELREEREYCSSANDSVIHQNKFSDMSSSFAETIISQLEPESMMRVFEVNALGPAIVAKVTQVFQQCPIMYVCSMSWFFDDFDTDLCINSLTAFLGAAKDRTGH